VPVNIFVEITAKLLSLCQKEIKTTEQSAISMSHCKIITQYKLPR